MQTPVVRELMRLFERRACGVLTVAVLAALGVWSSTGAVDQAYGCSAKTERVRQEEPQTRSPLAPWLPDCRAYEQVSPVSKNGVDASGTPGIVQASPDGDRIVFFATSPFSQTSGAAESPTYISARSPSGEDWLTEDLEALVPPGGTEHVSAATEGLGKAIIEVGSQQSTPPCNPRVMVCGLANEANAYIRDDATGTFEFLGALADGLTCPPCTSEVGFADATSDGSRVLFETAAQLTPEAVPGVVNLYLWDETRPSGERVSLAGVLPDGAAPQDGAFAGPGGPAVPRAFLPEEDWPYYTQNTISNDGSRVFFSEREKGFIYMRELGTERTVQISADKDSLVTKKPEPAFWRAATPDGTYVFYTEGSELYRFNVARFQTSSKPESDALEEAREQLTSGAEGVFGLLGTAEANGSYVYFAAPGVIATNENGSKEKAVKGAANVYEWHEGTLTFIVRLKAAELGKGQSDESDWRGRAMIIEAVGPSGDMKSSRVSTDGQYLLFSSVLQLTKYQNNGFSEFYLYDATKPLSQDNPMCVSCNPAGTPATSFAHLTKRNLALVAEVVARNAFMTHNLSDNGRRVFFETEEALVPGDANMKNDVYEWEADGEGSCESEAQNGGCLYLISTGQGPEGAYFGDASANGNDVFFFTRQSLVGQDQDNNVDLYDARVEGGMPNQYLTPTPAPCEEEAKCRTPASSQAPAFGVPDTIIFHGAGNLIQSPIAARPPHHTETRAEKLAKALKVCRGKPKTRRRSCERAARRQYGPTMRKSNARKGDRHR